MYVDTKRNLATTFRPRAVLYSARTSKIPFAYVCMSAQGG